MQWLSLGSISQRDLKPNSSKARHVLNVTGFFVWGRLFDFGRFHRCVIDDDGRLLLGWCLIACIGTKMLVHEGVVSAILAFLEKRQDDEAQARCEDAERDNGPCASNVCTSAFARFAADTAALRVKILVV